MDYIFGELPTALKVIIAFFVVLGLIGGATYVVRRFGADHLGAAAARGRQPRLALIDQAPIDNRRRLVLIRRDNVEHLLIIGGPTDVVVEQNIVRTATAATAAPRANAVVDTLPRPVPLAEGTMWPLQPQPEPPPRPHRPAPEETVQWTVPQPEPPPAPRTQRQADTLAGLAEELSARPARSGTAPESARMPPTPMMSEAEQTLSPAADANLAEMAQRLEAALRRPIPQEQKNGSGRPAAEQAPAKRAETPRAAARGQAKAGQAQPKTLYDSLEQEMASLLGRPGKS